ncbi:kinesin-like protein KIN-4C isoform X1 [Cajanus cajan]|uniref:kinesin-like protein KIN-4C isoform X1 n=1 Tax=Cajanus cajan TaxID=3821 RepID=UPI00098D97E0|nr:kinesin-like protein KIN-4C isoform X1 [Cajanus cajan]
MTKTNRRSKQSSPVHASASDPNEKQVYEERIRELERKNKAYQMEIAELRQQQGGDSSGSKNGVEKLKKEYLQKLNLLEDQVTELKTKLGTRSQFSIQRKKVDESTRQLQFEIQSLKAQKVQLQCMMKLKSVQFRLCKALLEKEVLQLKKEGTRKEIKTQSLLASNETLKMVLQRKTEEASSATKRLKDMIIARKAITHKSTGARSRNAQLIQDAERELEVTTQLHKLCSQYESKMDKMAGEIAQLKEEIEIHRQEKIGSQSQDEECESLEKDSEIQDLKEQMNSLGCLLRELQSQKEKLDFKDKKQGGLSLSLLSEESNDKIKMDTPEMSSASENSVKGERTAEGLCCSCSKKSLCKTNKCKCRSTGGSCGASCGCTRFKCTNRELNQLTGNEPLKSDYTECTVEVSAVDKDGSVIASECAKLLHSALVEKPASCKDNPVPKKKPLCDIQNSMGKLDDQKQGKKKKARKPVIQVITKDSVSLSEENSSSTETYKIESRENNPAGLDKVTESNSGQSNELATSISEAPGFRRLRNPTRQAKSVVGKENCYI